MTFNPIIVERMGRNRATRIRCIDCGAQGQADPATYSCDHGAPCPNDCGGHAEWMYWEADHKCPNCGKLGFFPDSVKPCCSRVCKLQTEYAAELAAKRNGQAT